MGAIGANRVLAQNTNGEPFSTLVQKIADKFNLKKEDVQAVFDQDRTDRQKEMEAKKSAALDQLVKDGKITQDQKQLIINKRKEMEANRQSEIQNMQGKTQEEKQTIREANKIKMETERKELDDWATQNGIDVKYLMGGFGRGYFGGMKGGMKGGWDMK